MKLKKTKIALISVTLLCLLLSCTHTGAVINITNIEHPPTVKQGKSFNVVVTFEYTTTHNCLYGDYIWLYYDVGFIPSVNLEGSQYIAKSISTPEPSVVTIKVNTSEITCAVNDTFRFRIKYNEGYKETPTSEIFNQGNATSGNYDITIIENPKLTRTNISFLAVILPLFAVATVIFLRKRRGLICS